MISGVIQNAGGFVDGKSNPEARGLLWDHFLLALAAKSATTKTWLFCKRKKKTKSILQQSYQKINGQKTNLEVKSNIGPLFF